MRAITKLCRPGGNKNIIAVFRQGEVQHAAFHYIDMELCDENLERYMEQHNTGGNRIMMPEIWNIVMQIANGLTFIHTHKEVHRDLKPRNSITLLISC